MNKKLSIIVPYLNETKEDVINTINSVNENIDPDLTEIIAIDDKSDIKIDLSNYKNVRQFRNKERKGVDWCRQMGGEIAKTPYLLILDAHMKLVKNNWLEIIEGCLKREPKSIFCTTCVGLGYGTMDLSKHKGKYYGADILLLDPTAPKSRESRECLEPKWRNKEDKIEYQIPCVLGANYYLTKEWFDYIHGFKGLCMWGSSEILVSLKSWMAGGQCKIRTDLELGHKFRSNSPFSTGIHYLYFNKAYICEVLNFPKELKEKILGSLPQNINYKNAMKLIEENKEEINKEKEYYKGIMKYDICEVCKKLNIEIPE